MKTENMIEMLLNASSEFALMWFGRPRLINHRMATEIIDVGEVSLDVTVKGWGYVRLKNTGQKSQGLWIFGQRNINFFIQVGAQPKLEMLNVFGVRRFLVDATTDRAEVWVSHERMFRQAGAVLALKFKQHPYREQLQNISVEQLARLTMISEKPLYDRLSTVRETALPTWQLTSDFCKMSCPNKPNIQSFQTEELK
jgi:hypothetical protein